MATAPGAAVAGSPYPQWSVNTTGYVVAEVGNAATKALAVTATWPDKLVFFTSQASADAWVASQGHSPVTTPVQTAGAAVINDATGPISTTAGLIGKAGRFLDDLTSGAFWMRIAEVVAGLVLLAVGVDHLFKARPLAAVTRTAGKLAPLAMA